MAKMKRGLRVREAISIIFASLLPTIIMASQTPLNTPKFLAAAAVNCVIAVVLTCVVEDLLECRGRYVDSGVSWNEACSWFKSSSLGRIAVVSNCFLAIFCGFAIWFVSSDVKELGLLVVICAAMVALNAISLMRKV